MQLHETRRGQIFFDHQIPKLISAIEALADATSGGPAVSVSKQDDAADRKMLQDLYYGEFMPMDGLRGMMASDIQPLEEEMSKIRGLLADMLSDESKALLNALDEKNNQRGSIEQAAAFAVGFKTAMRFSLTGR